MHRKNWCALWTVCLALGLVYNSAIRVLTCAIRVLTCAIRVLTCANSCTLYFTHLALGELQYIFPSVLNLGKDKEYAYRSKTETLTLAIFCLFLHVSLFQCKFFFLSVLYNVIFLSLFWRGRGGV